jgi:rubredoxin
MRRAEIRESNAILSTLREVRKAERTERIEDGSGPKGGLPRHERRRRTRERALPKDRVCPLCGLVKLASRQWVINEKGAFCKSCFMKGLSLQ